MKRKKPEKAPASYKLVMFRWKVNANYAYQKTAAYQITWFVIFATWIWLVPLSPLAFTAPKTFAINWYNFAAWVIGLMVVMSIADYIFYRRSRK